MTFTAAEAAFLALWAALFGAGVALWAFMSAGVVG